MKFNRRAFHGSKNSILPGVTMGSETLRGERRQSAVATALVQVKPQTKLQRGDVVSQPQIDTDFTDKEKRISPHPCESVAKVSSPDCPAWRGPKDKIAERRRIELEEIFVEAKIAESNRGPFNI
jgi:hypothetical protein